MSEKTELSVREAVFQRFEISTVAALTNKDERTVARWKRGNLTPEAHAVLAHLAQEFGLLDKDVLAITDAVRRVPSTKQPYLHEVLQNMRELKEREYRTLIDEGLSPPKHPLLRLAARYFKDRAFHPLADLVSGWSELEDFRKMPPDDQARALLFWGISLSRQTFFAKAEEILVRARTIAISDAMHININMELAIAVERQRRIGEARALLDQYRESDDPVVLFNLMCFHARQGGNEDVDQYAERLCKVHPQADDARDFIGEAVLNDPDLATYRRSASFRHRFRTLAIYVALVTIVLISAICSVAFMAYSVASHPELARFLAFLLHISRA